MKAKIFFIITVVLLSSCMESIDKKMWKFDKPTENYRADLQNKKLRTDGYYTNKKRISNHITEADHIILFSDGYMASVIRSISGKTLNYNKISKEISGNGKYKIFGDSILIQYFRNYETSGNFIGGIKYSVTEQTGYIVDDTTFVITKGAFNSISKFWGSVGINYESYNPPVTYWFIKLDSLPSSDAFINKRF